MARKGSVLVVDDEEIMRDVLETLLSADGYRNQLNEDRTLALFDIQSEAEYKMLEQARAIAQSDDTRQLTALAIAAT